MEKFDVTSLSNKEQINYKHDNKNNAVKKSTQESVYNNADLISQNDVNDVNLEIDDITKATIAFKHNF